MLSNRLSELRKQMKINQTELAKRLKIPRTTYIGYEKGYREPDHETLLIIAEFFDVSVDYLLGRSDEPNPLMPQSKDESLFFFDEENITEEELIELKKHLEFLRYKARQMEEEDK